MFFNTKQPSDKAYMVIAIPIDVPKTDFNYLYLQKHTCVLSLPSVQSSVMQGT